MDIKTTLFLVAALLAVTASSSTAQQLQQPNTTLNEFKNAPLAAAVADPDDAPETCMLNSSDLAAADLAVVAADCGEW
jgi:hypothetical protein